VKRFAPVPRPWGWQKHVLNCGRAWLKVAANLSAERPRDLWSPYRDRLAAGFGELCGYTVMWTPNGTVDHHVPWVMVKGTAKADLAYQWSNLRYSDGWFNSARGSTDVPDPYTVSDDWFELLLPSLELVATASVPASEVDRVNAALRWLGKDGRVIKKRHALWLAYRSLDPDGTPGMSFAQIERWAPLIARALRNNAKFLHPADRARLLAGTL